MSPSPPPPPAVVHVGKKSPTTAAAASGARGDSMGTAQFDDNQAATNSVSSFLQGKTFVQKIHTLLTMTNYSSIISWNDAGTAVLIHDVDAFISTIIPTHFKQSKFGSFIRKMRRWGFSVITKKRSTSRTSTSSERGQIAVMEFSSEHFLRDQPELCLLMKDERHVKTQFSFLDRTVRKAHNGVGENPDGVCVMKTSKNKSKSQKQSKESSFSSKDVGCAGAGDLNATINHGYPHNYAHANSMSPMITPHQHQQSFHSAMPMVNMMMPPPPPPPHQYPPYGYGPPPLPPQAPGLGFGPSSPPFQSPSAPNGYPPYPYQQQQVMQQYQQQQPQMTLLSPQQPQMMQPHLQQQQQMMQPYPQQPQQTVQQYQQQHQQQHQYQQQYQPQQQQQQIMQQNQQCPPPPTDDLNLTTVSSKRGLVTNFAASTTLNGCSDPTASSASGSAAVQLSSSEESTELLPNMDLNMRVYSRLNTEHNEV
ncbi:heat shock factor family protein [Skeletonema marinoi]|uniref:Heat shock factor family protein n=1 Tax=Skeletonema marinoi TaxID=267567 RepID=A0AAD8XVC1_9STRA|nr:heat shock factor family protein [Skeletonema marinoi]